MLQLLFKRCCLWKARVRFFCCLILNWIFFCLRRDFLEKLVDMQSSGRVVQVTFWLNFASTQPLQRHVNGRCSRHWFLCVCCAVLPCQAFNNNLSHVPAINADHFYSRNFYLHLHFMSLFFFVPREWFGHFRSHFAPSKIFISVKEPKKMEQNAIKAEKHLKKLWRNISRDGR